MRVFGQYVVVSSLVVGSVLVGAQAPVAPPPPAAPAARGPAAPPLPPPSQASIDQAAKILAEARKALGGETKQATVKTLVATGRTRRISGENLVPVEFEVNIELPDKYVRKDEVPAQETAPSSSGFNGDNLIQIPPPAPAPGMPGGPPLPAARTPAAAPAGAPAAPPLPGAPAGLAGPGGPGMAGRLGGPPMTPQQQREMRVTAIKQDFARLTLGMFAASFSSYPLTFSYVSQAEAPQGKADVIEARGAGNFTARLFLMSDTHLPIMVSWTSPVTPANIVITTPGQPKPATLPPGAIVIEGPAALAAGASKEDQDTYAKAVAALRQKAMAGTIENRIYYSDYRDTDGLQFPFKLRRAVGADTIEETTFDRFRLNAKIDPKKFDAVK